MPAFFALQLRPLCRPLRVQLPCVTFTSRRPHVAPRVARPNRDRALSLPRCVYQLQKLGGSPDSWWHFPGCLQSTPRAFSPSWQNKGCQFRSNRLFQRTCSKARWPCREWIGVAVPGGSVWPRHDRGWTRRGPVPCRLSVYSCFQRAPLHQAQRAGPPCVDVRR